MGSEDKQLVMEVCEKPEATVVTCRDCGWWVHSNKRDNARKKSFEHALHEHDRVSFHFVDITPLDA